MPKTTQQQYAVRVQGIPSNWNQMTGGHMTKAHENSFNGGSPDYDILTGPTTYSNITVTRPKRTEDENWLRDWRNKLRHRTATITKQELDANLVKKGKPLTYPNCVLVGINEVEPQAGSGSEATISLEFATTGPAR